MLRFSCTLALALVSGAALAQNSTTTVKPVTGSITGIAPTPVAPKLASFDDLDRNRDGFVQKEEVPVTHDIARAWTILDENLDNRLAREEFVAYNPDEGID
jgi:hypothetical protein